MVGRPPTPPSAPSIPRQAITMAPRNTKKPTTPRSASNSIASAFSKQSTKKSAITKTPVRANGNILNFFKKVDNPLKDDDSLFVAQRSGAASELPPRKPSPDLDDDDLYGANDEFMDGRYDEAERSIKKRKLSDKLTIEDSESSLTTPSMPTEPCTPPPAESPMSMEKAKPAIKAARRSGPFLDDSDSDEDLINEYHMQAQAGIEKKQPDDSMTRAISERSTKQKVVAPSDAKQEPIADNKLDMPSLATVLPLGGSVFKRIKRVPVARAQAKWEALQPRSARTMSLSEDAEQGASNGSKYFNSKLKGKVESESEYDEQEVSKSSKKIDRKDRGKGKGKRKSNLHPEVPDLKQENTMADTWADFENMGEFPDEDVDGEEFVERKWMEEQNHLEAVDEAQDDEDSFNGFDDDDNSNNNAGEGNVSTCPMCDANLSSITSDEVSMHVNACLDGKPIPLPAKVRVKVNSKSSEATLMPDGARNGFARKAAVPRPGQANPIDLNNDGGSAFSKIMSGHAEDSAWAIAADKEKSSRGKPAHQRTCPFYKIMPGLFICVDAFRYGAVKGCNAYFLSHFHSDHYIGLTSSWSHGPIYCSKVTGNLVKQQLRVDPKWVISIEFDDKIEVSNTQGVSVTMIPANHCPGSSLFLFEKNTGRGQNPKVQRILHCGDFRACPAHISHPLLMPNVVDSVTGKTKQQKIDVCYLDTTYLNPKFSFPSQDDVVKACADMCVSLSKENAEESDAWETVKRERTGAKMTKFIKSAPKTETEDSQAQEITPKTKNTARGRLLVVCGTYSIGKERIVLGIARALDCKIYAIPGKMRICAALEDPELTSRLTSDPREAQIHMQMLMELRPETLQDYLTGYKPHFTRVVGFRPSGWSYKPPNSRFVDSPPIHTILKAANWRSEYDMGELVPQRGSTNEVQCFGVPYSEHSSFRELTMFVMGLRIEKVVPTVNVGSEAGRKRMKMWIERWLGERRKHGVLKFGDGQNEGMIKW
ncbi:DNA cross-link repair protein PSO2/SNM1 [Ciborinia camelliae]|nr:DNA cross-link repair protein PSO2/SNM1 [Ciborinia camelliae]